MKLLASILVGFAFGWLLGRGQRVASFNEWTGYCLDAINGVTWHCVDSMHKLDASNCRVAP